jgi:hypothetical protein
MKEKHVQTIASYIFNTGFKSNLGSFGMLKATLNDMDISRKAPVQIPLDISICLKMEVSFGKRHGFCDAKVVFE